MKGKIQIAENLNSGIIYIIYCDLKTGNPFGCNIYTLKDYGNSENIAEGIIETLNENEIVLDFYGNINKIDDIFNAEKEFVYNKTIEKIKKKYDNMIHGNIIVTRLTKIIKQEDYANGLAWCLLSKRNEVY